MKDPAVLFYINDWLIATKGLKADAKGWYLNLILFQFDMGSLPNDIEELANLCDVRISEFEKFEQVFEQVLKQKFKQNSKGRLENEKAKEIIQKREQFKNKRSLSGKISYFIKFGIKHFKINKKQIEFLKENVDFENIDLKDEQVLKQVFKQKLELYINENEDINKDEIKKENIYKKFKHLTLKIEEFNKLKIKYTKKEIDDILNDIENYKKNTNYTSLYLTSLKWLKKEYGDRESETIIHDKNLLE